MKFKKMAGILWGLWVVLVCAGSPVFAETEGTEKLQEEGRRAVIKVVSITGNELTYYEEAQESETETDSETKASEHETEPESEGPENETAGKGGVAPGQAGDRGFDAGQAGSGEFNPSQTGGGGFAPSQTGSGESDSGQAGGGGFDSSQAGSAGFDPSQAGGGGFAPGQAGNGNFAPEQRESRMGTTTVYLPVAVVVHTDTGEEKTFSILEAGDELEVLLEKAENGEEMITEIWMKSVEGDEQ